MVDLVARLVITVFICLLVFGVVAGYTAFVFKMWAKEAQQEFEQWEREQHRWSNVRSSRSGPFVLRKQTHDERKV